jgi:hypothetical protein
MISEDLLHRIDDLIEKAGQSYKKSQNVPFDEVDDLYKKYVVRILNLDEGERLQILEIMEKSFKANSYHAQFSKWAGLCVGLADLLKHDENDFYDKSEAADIIVRLSRWHHTGGAIYEDFVPYAKKITGFLYGGIENLFYSLKKKKNIGNFTL